MRNQGLHTYLTRVALLWLCLTLPFFPLLSQTTNISGTINVYQKVIEVIPAKACVRVSSTAGLNPSAKVLLVQMKGATINTTNSSAFGDTVSLNEAGNYEVSTICTIIGDSVFLVHTLLNTYSPTAGKMQLVQFGEYVSANVTGAITTPPWNNTTGTGGVIALFVEDDLTLNQSVTADGMGFRGGAFVQSNMSCTNTISGYAYNGSLSTPQSGAYKGEGIADVIISQSGGRGAPANGGGGGNNHNNSGGGGGNLSRGGMGGGNSSSAGCLAAFKGEGAKALSSWSGRKIFLGGGGGAGHNNNGVQTLGGANGAGIIFIHANNIIGNGNFISANGSKGGNSQADGAGGGGGGGTIIMNINNAYTGSLSVRANGGDGGNSNDGGNIDRCYAGGGGGSGGVIYFNGAVPPVTNTIIAGLAGVESGRDAGCAAAQPAAAGNDGQVITNYSFRRSFSIAGYCSLILPAQLTSFKAVVVQKKVVLNWRVEDPGLLLMYTIQRWSEADGWININTVTGYDTQQDYNTEDSKPAPGYDLYRLKIIKKTNAVSYSAVRRIFIESDKAKFAVYPNPAHDKVFIEGNLSGMVNIRLLDISGKVILQKTILINTRTEINLPEIPAGIYMLHVNEKVEKLLVR